MIRIGLEKSTIKIFSDEYLEKFYRRKRVQNFVWKLICSGILRNEFGPLVELFIILDRAQFLKEKGYRVFLDKIFYHLISPKNIGLLGISN